MSDLENLREIVRLRQILWDIYGILGFDQDGVAEVPSPGNYSPDVPGTPKAT